jgi:ribosome maturation factor RimP
MLMSEATKSPGRIAELQPELEQIADAAGCELVHVEIKGGILRLFLDKPDGGVSLADCEHVSKLASAWLDVVDFGKSRYVLEVSSPGLDRQLFKARDYRRFVGRKVRVTMEDPATRKKKTVVGRLEAFDLAEGAPEGDARVIVVEEPKGERHEVSYRDIRQARLEIEL